MRHTCTSVLAALLAFVGACGSSSDGSGGASGGGGGGGLDGGGGSGGSSSCNAKTLSCGQVVLTSELATIFGETPIYDESGHPQCIIDLTGPTSGGVQVFCGQDYPVMLAGAKQAYPTTTEPNTTGQKSFEVNIPDLVEVGFVTTNGKYTVLVNLVTTTADIAKARTLAQKVDENLSKL